MINRHIIAVHNRFIAAQDRPLLLRIAEVSKTTANILFEGLKKFYAFTPDKEITFIMPESLQSRLFMPHPQIYYDDNCFVMENKIADRKDSWLIISNGSCITLVNPSVIGNVINKSVADLITINVDPTLKSNREIARVTSRGEVIGIRQVFSDSLMPDYFPSSWPNHTLVRISALNKIPNIEKLPLHFSSFLKLCVSNSLTMQALKIGGSVLDLETEAGLLDFIAICLSSNGFYVHKGGTVCLNQKCFPDTSRISSSARFYGHVVLGENVQVDDSAIIVGPSVIGNDARIYPSATVYASIICPGVSIPPDSVIKRRIIDLPQSQMLQHSPPSLNGADASKDNTHCIISLTDKSTAESFRTWPLLSYARFGKRSIDFVLSLLALLLLIPVFAVIAVVIKIAYPGPVFFKHKRQGFHGREFHCLKFRTMITGADELQEKLRFKNEVDGPQFKLEKDPRVTRIGNFLRDTYLDELPQLFNVISGQMSLIGPRPSPREENCLCACWRDARLSVRPGISGLWQISRTRKSGQDFQEWIHFDIEYVKNMSWRQDMLIFAKTLKELITNFFRRCARLLTRIAKLPSILHF